VGAAWNGSVYLVVWNDPASNQIFGRRLNSDGSFADSTPFAIMQGGEPGVAALGDTFLVIGTNAPQDPHFRFTFAARVQGSTGAVLDSPIQLGNYFARNPDVAAFSNRWIVVWERHPSHDDPSSEIKANFVNPDGTASSAVTVRTDFYTVRFHDNPSVGSSGDTALVVWEDPRVSNSDWNLYGRRVSSDGTLLDSNTGFAVNTAPNNQMRAAVAWDGNQFVVAFEDQRANTFFLDPRTDIFATRVDASGQVLDPNGFAVMNSSTPEIFPDASGGNGQAILAASVYREAVPYAAYRIGLRVLGAGAVLPTETPANTPTGTSPTATFTPAPLPTDTPAPTSMHVGDLDSMVTSSGRNWQATVDITVHDRQEQPLSGVVITGSWGIGYNGTATCTTGSAGICSITSGSIRKNINSVSFTVDTLSETGFTYDLAANHDPDGDSDGTTLTISR
jgi:hypothetical protein